MEFIPDTGTKPRRASLGMQLKIPDTLEDLEYKRIIGKYTW